MDRLRDWLLTEHGGTVCADRLAVLKEELESVAAAGTPGPVVEIGCYRGAMALWMRAVLDAVGEGDRLIHVYDSFRGLPEPGLHDIAELPMGELVASADEVIANHVRWDKRAPIIHAGWFADTLPTGLPEPIAFAYLDGDLYESILTSLKYSVPRLAPGAVLVVDDYADTAVNPKAWTGAPGVKKACDDYFGSPSPIRVVPGEGDLAFGLYRCGPAGYLDDGS
jgi:O-methyltransferase